MATINGNSYQDPRNINLRGGASGTGLIRWNPGQNALVNGGNWASNPFSTDDYGLYINAAGNLVFSSLGSSTVLGGTSPSGIPSWEQIFAGDNTFNVAGTTWTIDNSTGNNNVLTMTNSGAGSGHVIQITNAGTGKDVNGTSGTWSVSKLGAAAFLSVASATINGAGAGITIGDSGANVVTIGTNSNTITLAKASTFSSSLTITDGPIIHTSTSNTVAPYLLTNNTATTLGAGVSSLGLLAIRSTSLTTGNALLIQLAEGTLTTGFYINAWDSVGTASVFKVGLKGATTIAGNALGTAALTLTAGDIVVTSGKFLLTGPSNAVVFSVTANSTTSSNAAVFTGSGVHTGTGASAFVNVTQSGATTGSVFSVIGNGLTSGKLVELSSTGTITGVVVSIAAASLTTGTILDFGTTAALTTGVGLKIAHTTSIIADGGSLVRISSSGADTGGATNGTLLDLGNTAATAATLVLLTDTALTTGVGVKLVGSGIYTGAGYVTVTQNAATTGTVFVLNANGLTTGHGVSIVSTGTITTTGDLLSVAGNSATTSTGLVRISGTGLTSGVALLVTGSTTMTSAGIVASFSGSAATDGSVLKVATTGVYSGTVGVIALAANSLTTGTAVNFSATGITTGSLLQLNGSGATFSTGKLLDIVMGAATVGAGESIVSTGAYTGTGIVVWTANALSTGTLALISATGQTSGVVLSVTGGGANLLAAGALLDLEMGAATVGQAIKLVTSGTYTGVGVIQVTANGATTGTLVSVSATGMTTGTGLLITGAVATFTTGSYIRVNDGGSDIFRVGLNGHLIFAQTTAPTIAVTQQNGITAAAVTAGSTDVNGIITTTGTNNNGGTTILTVTFNKTYTNAPKAVNLTAANAAGAAPNPPYVSSITATTFVITIPASASAVATPSWYYSVLG